MKLSRNRFRNIYIEYACESDAVTQHILKVFPHSEIIYINRYKELFSTPKHAYSLQKASTSLILARKTNNFLYSGSQFAQSTGFKNFFYNTILLNCIYDCHYCYLQGLFPSPNLVCFTNLEDFFSNTSTAISQRNNQGEPLFLSLSYDTDILAFESIFPFARRWIEYCSNNNNLLVEIRTKSTNFKTLSDIPSIPNVIFSWSLSPEIIAQNFEIGAPSPKSRLASIKQAIRMGWKVRLCFDPVILIKSWREIYLDYFKTVFQEINPINIHDVTLGSFRMSSQHLKQARKHRPELGILHRDWKVNNGIASYGKEKREEISSFLRNELLQWFRPPQVSVW